MKRIQSAIACLLFVIIGATTAHAISINGGAAAISNAIGPCGNPCVVFGSSGGRVTDFEAAGDAIRSGARNRLVIDGYCASSCMVMADRARPRACITPRVVFAYHKTNWGRPIPLRADLRGWIMHHGGFPSFGANMGVMPNEVAKHFWPQCDNS
jgi:hypothetical protein